MEQRQVSRSDSRFEPLNTGILRLNRFALALGIGAVFFCGLAATPAQTITNSWTNTFDTASSTTSWCWWFNLEQDAYGFGYSALITNSWDATMNSTDLPPLGSGPASGALHWVLPWPGVPAGGSDGDQDLIYQTFAGDDPLDSSQTIDASKY